ncbi:hypothetical protein OCC_02822 [Thermococcus litoralis DSM 5473]|uniref:Class III signal peptide-containing protein n=1 Tax=Thermococcus litoralis (strain ATCC 51850 / DSM 5473 / JCM 8560 / NS-C) TaxID=523849 RepID=H3ZPY6_THELN|nr:class III signal peptide-containing protein [Thermococcus litoralis]EHR77949.1 hypothetical protein OCC_02822 [Thermococcus litoralis DSM 5473]
MKRRAQGALEYLFMIAAALIIIFLAVRYLTRTSSTATDLGNSTLENITQELENAGF